MTNRFLVDIAFSDDELAAYQRIVDAEGRQGAQHLAWGVYATGFATALIGMALAIRVGAIAANRADLVAALIYAGFFVGLWSPSIWYARRRRVAMRALAARGSLLVTDNGLFVRRAGARGFYARGAIAKVTVAGGLLLIWLREGRPLAIPLRLLDGAQTSRLLALAPTAR